MRSRLTGTQLSALYDLENRWAEDDDFFFDFVNEQANRRVLDLGCGTGRITLALAAQGHDMVGVDPNPDSLAAARGKPGADGVRWIAGTSAQIPEGEVFDVAIMTAHVAQAIHDDGEWSRTLADVHRALIPGGGWPSIPGTRLPAHGKAGRRRRRGSRHTLPDGTAVETWMESDQLPEGLVTLTEYRVLDESSSETGTSMLAFRPEEQLRRDLGTAGFTVEGILGGWAGESVGSGQGELIVLARKPS